MHVLIRYLPAYLIAFLFGVAIELASPGIISPVSILFIIAMIVLGMTIARGRRTVTIVVIVTLLFVSLGVYRTAYWRDAHVSQLSSFVGEKHTYVGNICDEPDVRETLTNVIICVEEVDQLALARSERMLARVERYPEYHYGDRLSLIATTQKPENFSTDGGGRIFDYVNYLAKDEIFVLSFRPKITVESVGGGNRIRTTLIAVKQRFLEELRQVIPEPENALLAGIVLGEKRSLGKEITTDFQISGLVHIIVLSGYNMTIVAQALSTLFVFLGFYARLGVGALGIILFALMAGGGATVVRASIMALLALFARATGRTYVAGRALFVAGFIMIFFEPLSLLYDPSFQLSFLASLGIIYVTPILEARWKILAGVPRLREIILTTISTQITVLPLLLYQTGVFSLYALPANILVLPTVPLTMGLGFATGLLGLIHPLLAGIIAIPTQLLLGFQLLVARVVSNLPAAGLSTPEISTGFVLFLYGVIFAVILFLHRKYPPQSF